MNSSTRTYTSADQLILIHQVKQGYVNRKKCHLKYTNDKNAIRTQQTQLYKGRHIVFSAEGG